MSFGDVLVFLAGVPIGVALAIIDWLMEIVRVNVRVW